MRCLRIIALTGLLLAPARAQDLRLTSWRIPVGASIVDTIVADFNGDGLEDVLVQTAELELRFFLQDAKGSGFRNARTLRLPVGTAAIAVADLVAPVGKDVVLLAAGGLQVVSLDSDGSPTIAHYAKVELVFPPGYRAAPRFWGRGDDLDGDGWCDLVVPGLEQDLLVFGRGKAPTMRAPVPISVSTNVRLQPRPSGAVGVRRQRPRIALHPVVRGRGPSPVYMDESGMRVLDGDLASGFKGDSRPLFPVRRNVGHPLDILQRLDVTLTDLDGDSLDDLILARTRVDTTSRVFEQRTQLLFFLNRGKPDGKPAQVLVLPGVLSNGPYLRDVNGDGRPDLFLSVYGGRITSNIARLILRHVRLEYHLYLGVEGTAPFPRSPHLTLKDRIPLAAFDEWDLRHRLFLQHDWTGNGRLDLVRIADGEDDGVTVEVVPAKIAKASVTFDGPPAATHQVPGPIRGYAVRSLSKNRPAVLVTGEKSLVFVTPLRR